MDLKNNTYSTPKNKTESELFFKKTITPEKLTEILTKDPSIINSIDEKGETLLSYALNKNQQELYDILINSPHLNLNYKDKDGNSYLHLAVINQNEKIVKLLINKGTNLNIQNKIGNTALHLAYEYRNNSIIKILIFNGINTLIKNNDNKKADEIKEIKMNKNKSSIYNNIMNKTTKNNNNKIEYEFKPIRKNGSNNIKNIKTFKNVNNKENKIKLKNHNKSENNMILKMYSKFIRSNPNFIIEKNKKFYNNNNNDKINVNKIYLNTNDNYEFELSEIKKMKNMIKLDNPKMNDENNIKVLSFKNYNRQRNIQEEIDSIKNFDSYNLLNNTSKETKFITDTKEKTNTNNLEELTSSLVESQSSELLNKSEKIKKYINKKDKNKDKDIKECKSKYLIYDRNYLINKTSKDTLSKNCKSYINLYNINSDKWNTIQNKYTEKNTNEKYISDNIVQYSINPQKNIYKIKSKKNSQLISYKKVNKNIDGNITTNPLLKNQKSFISQTSTNKNFFKKNYNIENNTNNNNNNNTNINHLLKKRNVNRVKKKNIFYEQKTAQNNKSLSSKSKNSYITKNNLFSENNNINNTSNNNIQNNISGFLDENGLTVNSSKLLKNFLSQINMDKYLAIFALNGFDDINLIIEQSKGGISSIKDNELKEAGIKIPGDRAKILIRIQEISNNFNFPVPKDVYYTIENKKNINIDDDGNIKKIKDWLRNLKIENYFNNFIQCGYYSIDLLLVQMASSNPLTNEILKDDFKIEKVGYRSRIINKLKEDSRKYIGELEINMLVLNNGEEKTDNCQCFIY